MAGSRCCSPSCFRPVDEEPAIADAVLLVTIYQKPASLTVSPDTVSLAVDGTATLSAAIQDANGHDIRLSGGGHGGLVVYWDTSDSAVATVEGVDATGYNNDNRGATATVTGVAAGSATILGAVVGNQGYRYGHGDGNGVADRILAKVVSSCSAREPRHLAPPPAVHRLVELVLVDLAELQRLAQGGHRAADRQRAEFRVHFVDGREN